MIRCRGEETCSADLHHESTSSNDSKDTPGAKDPQEAVQKSQRRAVPPLGRTVSHLEEEADDLAQSRIALYMPKGESKEAGCIH